MSVAEGPIAEGPIAEGPIAELADRPAPATLEEVLSAEWLTAVLRGRYPDTAVTGVTITETLKTVATKVRFDLAYAGDPKGAPPALCVKGYFSPDSLARGAGNSAEADFYRHLGPLLPVRMPTCVYTGTDSSTGQSLIVMNDLVTAGCRFLTALSPYSVDEAARTLDEIAAMHASTWDRADRLGFAFLASRLQTLLSYVSPERLDEHLGGPRGDGLPAAIKQPLRVQAAVRAVLALASGSPACVVHGDAHAGNIYLTPEGAPGLIDWQVVQQGCWALDVGYHIGAVLDIETRRASERDLLAHYCQRLAAHGGPVIEAESAWRSYRQHLAYGYFMWAITKMVDPPIIVTFTQRLGTAVADHGSFELLGV